MPVLRNQDVGTHSFQVMAIFLWVIAETNNDAHIGEGLYWIFRHDHDESISGDIPHPFKMALEGELGKDGSKRLYDRLEEALTSEYPKLKEWPSVNPPAHIKRLLEWCDRVESLVFLAEEIRMGNTRVSVATSKLFKYCSSLLPEVSSFPKCSKLLRDIDSTTPIPLTR